MLSRALVLVLVALSVAPGCGGDASPPVSRGNAPGQPLIGDAGDCVEVINPPQIPNCCRTPELAAEFIPTEPICWRDGAAYDEWRVRYRAAFMAGDCKAVHSDDPCTFD